MRVLRKPEVPRALPGSQSDFENSGRIPPALALGFAKADE